VEVKQLGIVGTGLIGASVGLAAKRAGVAHVVGHDFSDESLSTARERGAIDEPGRAIADLGEADLIVVAVPVTALQAVVRELLEAGGAATITDVGSTKSNVAGALGDPRFVGGHPVTGSEAHGPAHATADLFVLCTRTRSSGSQPSGEGYGIVLLEAQLAGCAVIGPAYGGSRDAYQDGVTGQTPVDESAEALADVLRSMLADRARLARTGRRAAEWAEAATRPDDYARLVLTSLTGRPPTLSVIPQPPPQPSDLPAARARADASSPMR